MGRGQCCEDWDRRMVGRVAILVGYLGAASLRRGPLRRGLKKVGEETLQSVPSAEVGMGLVWKSNGRLVRLERIKPGAVAGRIAKDQTAGDREAISCLLTQMLCWWYKPGALGTQMGALFALLWAEVWLVGW